MVFGLNGHVDDVNVIFGASRCSVRCVLCAHYTESCRDSIFQYMRLVVTQPELFEM
jgi:hypothetical protein